MILVTDDILPKDLLMGVKQSAIDSGFGTWAPGNNLLGRSEYDGMNWKGHHAAMHIAISRVMGRPIFSNQSFFRVLTESSDKRAIHSDLNDGSFTSITYLSGHEAVSGTAFYRHLETDSLYHPDPHAEGFQAGKWQGDSMDDSKWEQTDFVRGLFGRNLIFTAPLFHARFPLNGIGDSPENARMIHVCHFEV